MKIMIRLAILFYVTVTMFICCLVALFVLNIISFNDVALSLYAIYYDPTLRGVFFIMSVAVLLINYIFFDTNSVLDLSFYYIL